MLCCGHVRSLRFCVYVYDHCMYMHAVWDQCCGRPSLYAHGIGSVLRAPLALCTRYWISAAGAPRSMHTVLDQCCGRPSLYAHGMASVPRAPLALYTRYGISDHVLVFEHGQWGPYRGRFVSICRTERLNGTGVTPDLPAGNTQHAERHRQPLTQHTLYTL